jgi:hypothetical protein
MTNPSKKKNNHYVPRTYLRRFAPANGRQIGLYNISSHLLIEKAPIKSQCSRDYFYSKNPAYEERFAVVEAIQEKLLDEVLRSKVLPLKGSRDMTDLESGMMFQAGRTAASVAHANHMANQFGKAMLNHSLQREGKQELLEFLPSVTITVTNAVFDSIRQHLQMQPLIADLDCSLFLNETEEDFLTSDHPVVLCNGLPASFSKERTVGFASRGLVILYPISPRALIIWTDTEAYKIATGGDATCLIKNLREIIDLNLSQFANADENVYFANVGRVRRTIDAFRQREISVRPARPTIKETMTNVGSRRQVLLLQLERLIPRFVKPKIMTVRHSALEGRFRTGDKMVRDPLIAKAVHLAMDEFDNVVPRSN